MSHKKPKTTVIAVRVSIEQRETIEKAAVTAGASVSGFIAATMGEALSRKQGPSRPPAAPPVEVPPMRAAGVSFSDPAALAELKRIGININQLAHAANAGFPPNLTALIENLKGLLATLSEPEAFKRRLDAIDLAVFASKPPATEARIKVDAPPAATPSSSPSSPPPSRRLPPGLASLIGEPVPARPARALPARAVATTRESPPPRLPPRPTPQPAMKDDRRETEHPQARNQLQSRPELHPSRPAEGDQGADRLGFVRKLWGR